MSALWAVALILIVSGTAKLRSREDVLATFTRLRVPRPLAAPWLARAFPVLELLLGLALLQPVTALRPVVAVVALALFAAFLALVVRARGDGVSCGCFGAASAAPISGATITRNGLFLALAVLGVVEALAALAAHGPAVDWLPLDAFGAGAWAWALLVALLLAASAVLVGRESVPAPDPDLAAGVPATPTPAPAPAGAARADADADLADADPDRHPYPDAVVVADGAFTGLHDLARRGPVLALRLSLGCGSCSTVIARLPEFQDALGPVRLGVLMPQHQLDAPDPAAFAPVPAPLVLPDPAGRAATGLGLTTFPSAVLLGADLLTAGGPVYGADAVLDLLEEVRDIAATELAAPVGAPAASSAAASTPAAPTPADEGDRP